MSDVLEAHQVESLREIKKQIKNLGAEMTILRRSVEESLEAFNSYQAPSYDEEFGEIYQKCMNMTEGLKSVEKSPLVENPNNILREINRASSQKASEQVGKLSETVSSMERINKSLSCWISSARTREWQNLVLVFTFVGGMVFSAIMTEYVMPKLFS
jgi:hypothetical protein